MAIVRQATNDCAIASRRRSQASLAEPPAGQIAATCSLNGSLDQVGSEVEQQADREPDHVREIALEALDQDRAQPLDRVRAGAVAPLARGEIEVEHVLPQPPEGHLRGRHAGALPPLLTPYHEPSQDRVFA